ncbi:unnamed protein product [Cladocopium goreaui]|uniref:PDZ domain-containing protein n=1 Tax=Cladocopium goreaui TaxID=2562237 RepID=A0A9P1CXQ7_9DINO|nr:unnamed protein product [Cladocopium goreaui]
MNTKRNHRGLGGCGVGGLGGWEVLRWRKQSWKVKKRNDGDFIRFGTSKRDEVLGKWGGTNRCATARRLVVRFGDGRWANAELRGSSTVTDVAVLKLDVQVEPEASPLTFSRSLPKQGERVVVCGMTQHGQEVVGLSGLVSQPRQRFRGLPEEPSMHFVQLALPTLPGMSGSPVLNSEGKVCAMVAKKFEEHGLALPVERVLPVAECLEAGYPWRLPLLGMEVKAGGTLLNPSVLVKAFASASAAAKSGVEVGDEILEINGTKVATLLEMREALLAMGDGRVSSCRVKLRLRRQSRTVDVAFDAPRAPSGPQDVSMIELEE